MERYWSRFADDLDERESYVAGKEVIAAVLRKLGEERGLGRVLELGCGTGICTERILSSSESVMASDYSMEMVETARKRFFDEPRVRVEQVDCRNTGLDGGTFDTVVMVNLVHVIPDPHLAIREVRRVMKPGGVLLCSCFTTEEMSLWNKLTLLFRYLRTFGPFPKGKTAFTRELLSKLLVKEGFTVEEAVLLGTKTRSMFIRCRKSQIDHQQDY
jgi:ubiquinone/menaquinone biosynthesis C-methylase UbiE